MNITEKSSVATNIDRSRGSAVIVVTINFPNLTLLIVKTVKDVSQVRVELVKVNVERISTFAVIHAELVCIVIFGKKTIIIKKTKLKQQSTIQKTFLRYFLIAMTTYYKNCAKNENFDYQST